MSEKSSNSVLSVVAVLALVLVATAAVVWMGRVSRPASASPEVSGETASVKPPVPAKADLAPAPAPASAPVVVPAPIPVVPASSAAPEPAPAVGGKECPECPPIPDLPEPPVVTEPPEPEVVPVTEIRSVPGAQLWIRAAAGAPEEKLGRTNAEGVFRAKKPIPAGATVRCEHALYENAEVAVPAVGPSWKISPAGKPGSLSLSGDPNVVWFVDGRRVGSGVVLVGNLKSLTDYAVKAVAPGKPAEERTITVPPRDTARWDLRSSTHLESVRAAAASAPAAERVSEVLAPAKKPDQASPVTTPAPAPTSVRVVSVTSATALVGVRAEPAGSEAPLAIGAKGRVRQDGVGTAELECVRVFGGVSVCRYSGGDPVIGPASLSR